MDLRTKFAQGAAAFADEFKAAFKDVSLASADYVPELTVPEGPSTAGGVQAMQHLRLVPRAEGNVTLVVGAANRKESTAELRTFEHVDALHQQRFSKPVPLDRVQYSTFIAKAQSFLTEAGLTTSIAPLPDELVERIEGKRGGLLIGFVCGGAVVSVLAAVWWFLMR